MWSVKGLWWQKKILTNINSNEQYILDCEKSLKKCGEIPPDTATSKENDRMCDRSENCTWFANSVNCVSKWSKALKEGVKDSVGVGLGYTVPGQTEKSENLAFSFFL